MVTQAPRSTSALVLTYYMAAYRTLDGVTEQDFFRSTGTNSIPVCVNDGDAVRSGDEIPRTELAKAASTILEQGILMFRKDPV